MHNSNVTHTHTHRFTDPFSVETRLDIEFAMIKAGLQYAIKSEQYDTVVFKINEYTINNMKSSQAHNR